METVETSTLGDCTLLMIEQYKWQDGRGRDTHHEARCTTRLETYHECWSVIYISDTNCIR